MLLSRYSNVEFVMNMRVEDGIELIKKAYKSRTDEQLMQRWILGGYDREISFDELKDKLFVHRTHTNKTDEEILIDVKEIIEAFNGKVVK